MTMKPFVVLAAVIIFLLPFAARSADIEGTGQKQQLPIKSMVEPPESPLVDEVVAHARKLGVDPVVALLDEGDISHRTGRYREAVQLFTAAAKRDPTGHVARKRLNEALDEVDRAVGLRLASGERAFTQSRFDAAIIEWERVLLLIEPSDPRYATAQAGIERARMRMTQ